MTPQESFKKSAEERYTIPARRWSYRQGAEEGYRKAIEILRLTAHKKYYPIEKKCIEECVQLLVDLLKG